MAINGESLYCQRPLMGRHQIFRILAAPRAVTYRVAGGALANAVRWFTGTDARFDRKTPCQLRRRLSRGVLALLRRIERTSLTSALRRASAIRPRAKRGGFAAEIPAAGSDKA